LDIGEVWALKNRRASPVSNAGLNYSSKETRRSYM